MTPEELLAGLDVRTLLGLLAVFPGGAPLLVDAHHCGALAVAVADDTAVRLRLYRNP